VHCASRPPCAPMGEYGYHGCRRIQRRRGNRTLASPKLDCRGRAAPASPSVGGVAANASRAGYVSRASPGCSVLGAGHRARGPGCVAPSDDVWRDQGPGRPEPPYLSDRRLMRHGWGWRVDAQSARFPGTVSPGRNARCSSAAWCTRRPTGRATCGAGATAGAACRNGGRGGADQRGPRSKAPTYDGGGAGPGTGRAGGRRQIADMQAG
jgi:hypothetical protein